MTNLRDTLILGGILIACTIFSFNGLFRDLATPARSAPAVAANSSMGGAPQDQAPPIFNEPLAPDEPQQYDLDRPETFSFKGYQIHELASFKVRAVLLSKRYYSSDSDAHRSVLSPGDFSIGWGPMSNPAVLKNFTYFQKNRFLYYASYESFVHEGLRLKVDSHLANVHLIPANDSITAALNSVNPRDVVVLEGSLVEVFFNKQRIWKSSMVNTATGDGACKLLFLRRMEWYSHPKGTDSIPLPHDPDADAPLPPGAK